MSDKSKLYILSGAVATALMVVIKVVATVINKTVVILLGV